MLTQQLRKKANTASLSAQEQGLYDVLLTLSEDMEAMMMQIGGDLVDERGNLDTEVLAEEASQQDPLFKRYDELAEYLAEMRAQDIVDVEINRRIEQHEERRLRKSLQPEWKPE